ncbi:hypothetical protein [Marinimicrobium alkaliphilum]|uniref:hypothetical protein n=1 Tax=Marinimicrobium alkaliphilum TaxID=2202654 RepID=UPI000DB98BDE|nr:hypothetical protein [Marinimicrobium alkaliphilum]
MMKLFAIAAFLVCLSACDSGSSGAPPGTGSPEPPEEQPSVTDMVAGEVYTVTINDRLVVTSADAALIELVYTLDLDTGEDGTQVQLREGSAELFQ